MPVIDTWRGKKAFEAARAFMGWGGLIVNDDGIDVLDMLRAYMETAAGESCGQCFPCRSGLKRLAARLAALCDGVSRPDDLDYLAGLAQLVHSSARCDIGQTAPRPLLDILETAPHLLKARKTVPGAYAGIVTAPCINACPGHVNVPAYIEKIRFRRFEEGLACVMDNCPMPGAIGRVCERPCEAACKRGLAGEPVSIRHLKRFLFDKDAQAGKSAGRRPPPEGAKKVAVIGAGPAGLSCAFYLSRLGFSVVVLERCAFSGGMARYGIPDYRLPPSVLGREVDIAQSAGFSIKNNVAAGSDVTLRELKEQGYEAVFIGVGAPDAPGMQCEGENECVTGYVSGIHYLGEAAEGRQAISGKRVVVVGGGNVAMDCVRTALRHGFEDVRILYRRTEQEMPADKGEREEAKKEGVAFNFLAAPMRILHENGRVTGLVCQKMQLGAPDASGRRSPVPCEGETFVLPCDVIIHAIGQKVALDSILRGFEGGRSKWGTLAADSLTGKVQALPGIYGGGDCVTGPKTLIAALAAGKRAAEHIAAQLNGFDEGPTESEKLEHMLMRMDICDPNEQAPLPDDTEVMPVHTMPLSERLKGFDEVELKSEEWEAVREASRCLRCYRVAMAAL